MEHPANKGLTLTEAGGRAEYPAAAPGWQCYVCGKCSSRSLLFHWHITSCVISFIDKYASSEAFSTDTAAPQAWQPCRAPLVQHRQMQAVHADIALMWLPALQRQAAGCNVRRNCLAAGGSPPNAAGSLLCSRRTPSVARCDAPSELRCCRSRSLRTTQCPSLYLLFRAV